VTPQRRDFVTELSECCENPDVETALYELAHHKASTRRPARLCRRCQHWDFSIMGLKTGKQPVRWPPRTAAHRKDAIAPAATCRSSLTAGPRREIISHRGKPQGGFPHVRERVRVGGRSGVVSEAGRPADDVRSAGKIDANDDTISDVDEEVRSSG
jgi:hypothetical protein